MYVWFYLIQALQHSNNTDICHWGCTHIMFTILIRKQLPSTNEKNCVGTQCEISTNLYTHVQSVHTWKTEKEGGRGFYVHSFGHLPILVSYWSVELFSKLFALMKILCMHNAHNNLRVWDWQLDNFFFYLWALYSLS